MRTLVIPQEKADQLQAAVEEFRQTHPLDKSRLEKKILWRTVGMLSYLAANGTSSEQKLANELLDGMLREVAP